jgi:hypothetical protein
MPAPVLLRGPAAQNLLSASRGGKKIKIKSQSKSKSKSKSEAAYRPAWLLVWICETSLGW